MKLSVVIPAYNEEGCIEKVIREISGLLDRESIPYEIVAVNDSSTDGTAGIIESLVSGIDGVRAVHRKLPRGFGRAVREGLDNVRGDAVVIAMGDASDDAGDIVKYYRKLEEGYDCVFGSRFMKESIVRGYPPFKLFVNRIANTLIRMMFLLKENDITNAFKAYRREVIEAVKPLVSNQFNITIEIPLKAVNRGFRFTQIPINWYGRVSGVSKLKLSELQKKYFFTLIYCWLEKLMLKDEVTKERSS